MVLDAGKMVSSHGYYTSTGVWYLLAADVAVPQTEFDAPGVLLSREDSHFRRLVDDSPKQERRALYAAVRA